MRSPRGLFVQRLALMVAMETGSYYDAHASQAHIVDQTGLKGDFDFELKYAPPFRPPMLSSSQAASVATDPSGGPTIFGAIEAQLGLTLQKFESRLPVLLIRPVVKTPADN